MIFEIDVAWDRWHQRWEACAVDVTTGQESWGEGTTADEARADAIRQGAKTEEA